MKLSARLVATVALASLGGTIALGQEAPLPTPPDGVAITERAFHDTLGINVHVNYNDGAYADLTQVVRDLNYIGFRHIRTHAGGGVVPLSSYVNMAKVGVRFNLLARSDKHPDVSVDFARQLARQAPGSIVSIEGFNEINNGPITFNGERSENAAKAAQRALYAKVKATPELARLPVLYFTGGTAVSSLSGMADIANIHAYNNNATQPGPWFTRAIRQFSGSAANLPRMNTEFGNFALPAGWPAGKPWWGSPTALGVDQTTQAKVVLTGFFEGIAQGYSRTYVYELLDQKLDPQGKQAEFHYGLFTFRHEPKVSAKALRNLTTFLRGTASSKVTGTVSGKIEEASARIGWVRIRRNDGSLLLAVWNRAPYWEWDQHSSRPVASAMMPAVAVVTSETANVRATLFDPLTGTRRLLPASGAGRFDISVPNHPVLIWFK